MPDRTNPFTFKRVSIGVGVLVLTIFAVIFSTEIVETNILGKVQIKQAAGTGTLTCKLDPGMYLQLFGDIHTYEEAQTFPFQGYPSRFSDGTKTEVSGSVQVLLPVTDCDAMVKIHRKFGSFAGVITQVVEPGLKKSLYNTGPHMTADESYESRRGEYQDLAEDQLANGVLRTNPIQKTRINPYSREEEVLNTVEVVSCDLDGLTCVNGLSRQPSMFSPYNIRLANFVIKSIKYPDAVNTQIEQQRQAQMNIEVQQAQALEADARARRAISEEKAQIAETRATEEKAKTELTVRAEAAKAVAVLDAERVKDVARLEKEAAEFEKKKLILQGEGQAAKKRLVMQADGALEKKLQALVAINQVWADAFAKRNVPSTVFGGAGGAAGGDNDVNNFMKLMNMQAVKQLSVDVRTK